MLLKPLVSGGLRLLSACFPAGVVIGGGWRLVVLLGLSRLLGLSFLRFLFCPLGGFSPQVHHHLQLVQTFLKRFSPRNVPWKR